MNRLWILLMLVPATSALAQLREPLPPVTVQIKPEDVAIEAKPGAQFPMDATFTDDTGRSVTVRDYAKSGRPIVLQIGYFGCPMLCGATSQGLVDALKISKLAVGKEIEVVYVSIDPRETPDLAANKKASFIAALGQPDAASGFHLLVGTDDQIHRVTDAMGFKYLWIESQRQFAHSAGVFILTPDGRLSQFLEGVAFNPDTFRLASVEASSGHIGTAKERFMLFTCLKYDEKSGKYVLGAIKLMRLGGVFTILAIGSTIGTLLWREHRRRRSAADKGDTPREAA
jgi:protein SCO1